MSEKMDKNFLSTIGWNPIKIRKSSQTSNNNSNDTKLFELEKSTESIDTVGSENSEDNPESRKPSFLARQLQKLKFRGKSGQSTTASDEKVNSQGTNIDATEKDEVKSNTIGLHIDSPDLNDGDRSSTYPTTRVLEVSKRVRGPHNRQRKISRDVHKTDFNDIEHLL